MTDLGNGNFGDSFDQSVITIEICGETLLATDSIITKTLAPTTKNNFTPLCDEINGLIGTWILESPPEFQTVTFDETNIVLDYGYCTESGTYLMVSDSIFTVTTTSATCYGGPYGETFNVTYELVGDSLTIFGDIEYQYNRQ